MNNLIRRLAVNQSKRLEFRVFFFYFTSILFFRQRKKDLFRPLFGYIVNGNETQDAKYPNEHLKYIT